MNTRILIITGVASIVFNAVTAQDFTKHPVASGYNSWSAVVADIDDDGDQDIVGSSRLTSRISWWENDGDENFTLHPISTNAANAMAVCVADLDSDGDMDVACAVQEADAIIWWENNGEEVFTQHTLASVLSPSYLATCDLDQDGDMDVLVAACEEGSDKIAWCENLGNQLFSVHIIRDNWDHANSVYAADMDYDGDIDVLATASFRTSTTSNGEITWFENDGDQNFTGHMIISNYGRPSCAVAEDIDNDQDMDVVASVCKLNQIVLFKNNGDLSFTPVIIASNFYRPHCVSIADLDNDFDKDIIATSIDGKQIAWWENEAMNFIKKVVADSFGGATSVVSCDIDNDGDLDVLGTAQFDDEIAWWENSLITGTRESGVLFHQPEYLHQNIPNPFSEGTCIRFILPHDSPVTLTIHDISGKLIKTLISMKLAVGDHSITWDGRCNDGTLVSEGFYACKLKMNDYEYSKIMIKKRM